MNAPWSEERGAEPFAPFDTDPSQTRMTDSARSPVPPGTLVAPLSVVTPLAPSPQHFPWSRHKVASRREADQDALIAALTGALAHETRTIAVMGAKGGVGTTTVTLLAALLLAEVPGARPLVVELAPDGGTVACQIGTRRGRTAADLLAHLTVAHRDGIGFVQGFLTVWGRLPVLPAPCPLDGAVPLTPDDCASVLSLLGRYYNIVLLDCGVTVTHPLVQFAIRAADHALLVGHPDPVATLRTAMLTTYLMHNLERRRDPTSVTVAVNQSSTATPPFFADPQWKEVIPTLNAALSLPYSEPLRRRLDAGTLAVETVPADTRRATKGVLAAVLGRLAHP